MKKVTPKETYAYDLIYNFYEIGGVPHIVVSKLGMIPPKTYTVDQTSKNEPSIIDDFSRSAAMKGDGAKLVKQSTGGGNASGPSQFTYGILLPVPKNYAEKKGARVYFDDPESLNQMRSFIAKYTDGNDEFTTDRPENKNANYLSSNWTKTRGGGGNLYFGRSSGANATVVAGTNKGKDIVIKRTYRVKSGEGKGAIAGTGITEWVNLGTIELAPTTFADNMITIQQGAYQTILDQIKQSVSKLKTEERFEGVEIKATIQGYASSRNATNRAAAGVTPDHTWGNRIQLNQWITS